MRIALIWVLLPLQALAADLSTLPDLDMGRLDAQNALWIENPIASRFDGSRTVTVAEINGPARIEMIHFAMPAKLTLNRDVIFRIYWDGEETSSVECPLVDFFCDPAGKFDSVDTALVNKRRGFNSYFPMPFKVSAKVVLAYDGELPAGQELWAAMPCYSYVMYRKLDAIPDAAGYFHASWRQQALYLGKEPYLALDAQGKGKFVGWNVTVRTPGRRGYPVDMNEDFFVDCEKTPAVSFQGLEDSFGFSWGFPESQSEFQRAGYREFMDGAMAYRFFINDAITFEKSLKVLIQFGPEEISFTDTFSKTILQFSSVAYWYQSEPHAALPVMLSAVDRAPAPDDNPLWPGREELPTADELRKQGVLLHMRCGRPGEEVIFAESGCGLAGKNGFPWVGFPPPIYHCLADNKELTVTLNVPASTSGKLRIFITDPDVFMGGRKEALSVDGEEIGNYESFKDGVWVEAPVTPDMCADGQLVVAVRNNRPDANAVISIIELLGSAPAQ